MKRRKKVSKPSRTNFLSSLEVELQTHSFNQRFLDEIGVKKSSAQITDHYNPQSLVGIQVAAVINFPKKQIGPFMSECLVTGFTQPDGSIILAVPHKGALNGSRLA